MSIVGSTFEKLARKALVKVLQRGDACEVAPDQTLSGKKDIVAVCLNSMRFTAIMFFVYPRNRDSLSFILGPDAADEVFGEAEQSSGRVDLLSDRYSEIANMVVGRMRQDMSEAFKFTGQSTPMMLNVSDVAAHIDRLSASLRFSFGVSDGERQVMTLHSALYCSDVKSLTFPVQSDVSGESSRDVESDEGSLELL
jgi:hypothetical protein